MLRVAPRQLSASLSSGVGARSQPAIHDRDRYLGRMPASARSRRAPVSRRDGRRSCVHHEIASSSRLTVTAISTFANNLVGILVKRRGGGSEYAMRFEPEARRAGGTKLFLNPGQGSATRPRSPNEPCDTRARTNPKKDGSRPGGSVFSIFAAGAWHGSRCLARKTVVPRLHAGNRTRVRHKEAASLA